MKPLVFVILLTVLSHIGFVGSRITVSLAALNADSSAVWTVGVLMALFAAVPMLIGVHAGRLMDRVGLHRPLAISSAALVTGILLPFGWPGIPMMYAAAVLIGTSFMLQHIALNHLVGWIGDPADRAVNFSWLALGYAISGFIGPLLAGFAIDLLGHRMAFLLLALPPAAAGALFLWRRPALPPVQEPKSDAAKHRLSDLLREPQLRAAFLFSGLLATGWDLYTFVIPLYGTSVGLSPSIIGIVMSTFALATFVVRLAMPTVARRLNEWTVVCAALVISGCAYSLFPFVEKVPFLIGLSFVLGIGLGCAQPMIMAVLYTSSPAGRQGEAVGVRTTMINASHTFLPLLFGAVGATLGIGTVFWSMSALLLSGGWLANRKR